MRPAGSTGRPCEPQRENQPALFGSRAGRNRTVTHRRDLPATITSQNEVLSERYVQNNLTQLVSSSASNSPVLAGDTRPSDNLGAHAQAVDVLVHEVQIPARSRDLRARETPDGRVLPHPSRPKHEARLRAATPYDGPLTVAHDLTIITIGEGIVIADRPRAQAQSFDGSGARRWRASRQRYPRPDAAGTRRDLCLSYSTTLITTRRFWARPSLFLLSATGFVSP